MFYNNIYLIVMYSEVGMWYIRKFLSKLFCIKKRKTNYHLTKKTLLTLFYFNRYLLFPSNFTSTTECHLTLLKNILLKRFNIRDLNIYDLLLLTFQYWTGTDVGLNNSIFCTIILVRLNVTIRLYTLFNKSSMSNYSKQWILISWFFDHWDYQL